MATLVRMGEEEGREGEEGDGGGKSEDGEEGDLHERGGGKYPEPRHPKGINDLTHGNKGGGGGGGDKGQCISQFTRLSLSWASSHSLLQPLLHVLDPPRQQPAGVQVKREADFLRLYTAIEYDTGIHECGRSSSY
ncbi:hypothetical protein Pcinc_040779 [Petrolisthes cinctipes]|uniref:Uncharacterized protein n=1 Tax=Petrolisthes cinctipes TaxID=88211 RepID=A0AAE1BLJ9_PETCI|nr:hypothetical protein Pcinc_040779 [Petrolisthes cinctipes]